MNLYENTIFEISVQLMKHDGTFIYARGTAILFEILVVSFFPL